MTRHFCFTAIAVSGLLTLSLAEARPSATDDVLARSRAVYAALRSYADTGTVEMELGPVGATIHERHTFKTYYRAPRHFYFDFVKQEHADRFVVWSDDQAFHTWWQATGVADIYPKGQGGGAFVAGGQPTLNSLTQIAPLLFPQAELVGTLTEFADATAAGTETLGGRRTLKFVGVARSIYQGTGHVVNVRKTTVWIDADTLLIRKVFEDTPEGGPANDITHVTTTFEPQANPTLDDARFAFTPPK